MEHSQRSTSNDSSNPASTSTNLMPNVLFREIHKNAFLKRHSSDRRTGFPRKTEKVWVVFCVHDDIEPFLEIYPDQKVALTHKPEWFASLSNVLHVSPTICGHEDEYEFAVTLSFQVVRLSAPSWDAMMEWVETIRNKLRELKVLCPKENIYSKMPEPKQPLLPTRDPNSPLPLPPEGPSTLLPGVEIVHIETRNGPSNIENGLRYPREGHSRNGNNHERRNNKRRGNQTDRDTRNTDVSHSDESHSNSENQSEINVLEVASGSSFNGQINKLKVKRAASVPQPMPSTSNIPTSSNITVIEVSTPNVRENHSLSDYNPSLNVDTNSDNEDDVFVSSAHAKPSLKSSIPVNSNVDEAHYEHVFVSSVPVVKPQVTQDIKLNCAPADASKFKKTHSTSVIISSSNSNHISSSQGDNASTSCASSSSTADILISNPSSVKIENSEMNDSNNGPISPQIQAKLEKVNISGFIPRVPAKSSKSAFKPVCSNVKDPNVAVRKNDDLEMPSTSSNLRMVNGESSKCSNTSVPLPADAYSQVKKVPKMKVKNEEQASPVVSRRKINEGQVVDIENKNAKRLENHAPVCLNKIQPKPSEGKPHPKESKKPDIIASKNISHNLPSSSSSSSESRNDIPSGSGNKNNNGSKINIPKKDALVPSNNNLEVEPIIATVQPAVGVINVEDIPLIGGHQRRRRRSSSSDPAPAPSVPSSRGIGGADRIRINVPVSGNLSARETHRTEAESRSSRTVPEPNCHVNVAPQATRLTLREQQVLQLKKEMLHPGGVRLQLRRKDCTNSIALVDVLNGVWVAGWKQKEHPLLYNALHIGDQLVSIGEVVVRNSAEAHKLIRSSTSLYIEFIIRRVPFGNVFALQRSSEGQNLGIVQEGNTAEIKDVLPNSVAARQGLTSKTPSCDGLSLTTWFLTEINGRPLNLFFKDNEVRDRLNAVGKEISILVQPSDFIKQIKKQLKNLRSYKDYIVQ